MRVEEAIHFPRTDWMVILSMICRMVFNVRKRLGYLNVTR
jgi:hypothetical protein